MKNALCLRSQYTNAQSAMEQVINKQKGEEKTMNQAGRPKAIHNEMRETSWSTDYILQHLPFSAILHATKVGMS